MGRIIGVYREPFSFEPRHVEYSKPERLDRMAARLGLKGFQGVVCINGQPVPSAIWPLITPKVPANGGPLEVTFHKRIAGGDDDGKSVFALIASIGLTIATGFIAGGGLATKGGLFAANSISANLLAGGVSLVGSLLLNALSPPPSFNDQGGQDSTRRIAAARGNVLEPNGAVPRVVGQRRVFPPLAVEPLVTFDGPDEIVEAVYALAGPHGVSDIRIGSAVIDDIPGVEYEVQEGFEGQPRPRIVQRYGRTDAVGSELRGHIVRDDNQQLLDIEGSDVRLAVPQAQVVTTREKPDEHQLQIAFPQGLSQDADDSKLIRVPMRLRIRRLGTSSWINLPELHFRAASLRPLRATIKLLWGEFDAVSLESGRREGFVEARRFSPAQTDAPPGPSWTADSYFYSGSGDNWMDQNNLGSTGVRNVVTGRYDATFYLDVSSFERGRYEVEIVRGCAIEDTHYTANGYTYRGHVRDFFGYVGTTPEIAESRAGMADTLALQRSVSIRNEYPIGRGPIAYLEVKARNIELDRVSVVAGGRVPDWSEIQPARFVGNPDLTKAQGDTILEAEFTRDADLRAAFDVSFTPNSEGFSFGIIWEQGGSFSGSYLGVRDGFLVWRAGSGGLPPDANAARISTPIAPWIGKRVTVFVDARISSATCRMWIYDQFSGAVFGPLFATSGAWPNAEWSGTNAGGIGFEAGGDMVEGEATANFNGTIHNAKFWTGSSGNPLLAPEFAWIGNNITSNPAPHLRDIFSGRMNANPVPKSVLDDDRLIEWRSACATAGYTCDAILDDVSVMEAATIVAACGYGKPYMSEVWGVVRDYDRSSDSPSQMFTPRNSNGYSVSKAFPLLPDGLRVNFDDAALDYERRQIVVYRKGREGSANVEQVTYEGLVIEADVIARARYDLAQLEYRDAIHSIEVGVESVLCRRGDLVALAHDTLSDRMGAGRIVDYGLTDSGVDFIQLDNAVSTINEPYVDDVANFDLVENVDLLGVKTGVAIRRDNGIVTTHIATNATGENDTLDFNPAIDGSNISEGALVTVGKSAYEVKRMIVFSVEPRDELSASLTLVDEGNEVFA